MRSTCRRWFKSCAASKRTNSSPVAVCVPRGPHSTPSSSRSVLRLPRTLRRDDDGCLNVPVFLHIPRRLLALAQLSVHAGQGEVRLGSQSCLFFQLSDASEGSLCCCGVTCRRRPAQRVECVCHVRSNCVRTLQFFCSFLHFPFLQKHISKTICCFAVSRLCLDL